MIALAFFVLLSIAWVPQDANYPLFSRREHIRNQSSWDIYNTWRGKEVTVDLTVQRCLKYRVLIDRWNPDFHLDPALVMAVMAQECDCTPGAADPSGVGSVGLMQVVPRAWTASAPALEDPATNIYWGMKILFGAINSEKFNPNHDIALALAGYNCGFEKVAKDDCGSTGGMNYARRVLDFWLPRILAQNP